MTDGNKIKKVKKHEILMSNREMFPIKRIEQSHFELNNYYSQIIAFQDKNLKYQEIVLKFSKILSELDEVIEDMRKYNNNNIDKEIISLNK